MLFCIGDDVLKSLENEENLEKTEEVMEKLCSLVRSNDNVLSVESNRILSVAKKITESPKIGSFTKRIINYCYKTFTIHYGLYSKLVNKIMINVEKSVQPEDLISLSLDEIIKLDLYISSRITLLSEDLSDCKFYQHLGIEYCKIKKIYEGYNINFKRIAGAGPNIGRQLKESVTHNREIVLAICDSDKRHPEEMSSDKTANYLDTAKNELFDSDYNYFFTYVLEVSEKENLILPSEYDKFVERRMKSTVDRFIELENNEEISHYLRFIDFKVGITKATYLANVKYYEDLFSAAPNFRKVSDLSKIKDNESVSYYLEKKCITNIKYDALDFNQVNYVSDIRDKVCAFVIAWGIASPRFNLI